MKLTSLCRRTDLMLARHFSQIVERDHYVVVRSPENPNYQWGNYIVFERPPQAGDKPRWEATYRREFDFMDSHPNMVFTWEVPEPGVTEEFTQSGYELDCAVGLVLRELTPPSHRGADVSIRALKSDHDWKLGLESQIAVADAEDQTPGFVAFKRRQMKEFRTLCETGHGCFFGAFRGPKLVGHLGLFWEGELGRYQTIGTHQAHRRQGVCGTLVYETARWALAERGLKTLVIEAEAEESARRVYQSVGFGVVERNYALSPE